MATLKLLILGALVLLITNSCNIFEMKGFVTTHVGVEERFDQSMEWNAEHGYAEISMPNNEYSIIAMGDSHLGGTENIKLFLNHAQDDEVAAAVMVGDLTTGNKEDIEILWNELPSKDSVNYFAIAGNHDLYFDGWPHFYEKFGSSSYYFIVNTPSNNDLFICLDTGGGTLGKSQIAWFSQILEDMRSDFRYCVVLTHNNLFRFRPTTSTNPMVEELHVLLDLFIKHEVDVVVNAHDHKRGEKVFGNTNFIIMDALQDINKNASFLKMNIDASSISSDYIDL